MLRLARSHDGRPEVFHSLQGEGPTLGQPRVFVRASLCNLHCVWCDTDYTWNWQGTPFAHARDGDPSYSKFRRQEEIVELTAAETAAEVARFSCTSVVLTGGEPMLQQKGWIELMDRLRQRDAAYRFEVETNGTILPLPAFDEQIEQYNVAPKLANSAVPGPLRVKSTALPFFASSRKAFFKFVVVAPEDLEEVLELVERYGIPRGRVYLMPEGTTSEVLRERAPWVAEAAKDHGFHFSDRLHIRLWGSRRGV